MLNVSFFLKFYFGVYNKIFYGNIYMGKGIFNDKFALNNPTALLQ